MTKYLDKVNFNIVLGIILLLNYLWVTSGEIHMLPTFSQIISGFSELINEKRLLYHFFKSFSLFLKAIFFSLIVSLSLVYISPFKVTKPLSTFLSKCRYLPIVGFTYYASLVFESARHVQEFMLTFFISTFFITGLLSMVADISDEEWNHAKTLGLSKWEQIRELIIYGRIDYVIDILRQNTAISWMMIATVEMILFGNGGLGTLLKTAYKWGGQGKIIALYITILLIGISVDYTLNYARKLFFRYTF